MPYMKSKHITANYDGEIETEDAVGESTVYKATQMMPALDGTWMAVDYFFHEKSQSFAWYVTTQ